ncbi:hypothetical protein BDR22DRAFT_885096 [Usnea florida]
MAHAKVSRGVSMRYKGPVHDDLLLAKKAEKNQNSTLQGFMRYDLENTAFLVIKSFIVRCSIVIAHSQLRHRRDKNMSFGIGLSDILAVSKLARSIWGLFKDSSDQFKAIHNEVASLCLVLDLVREAVAPNTPGLELSNEQKANLSILIKGTEDALKELASKIDKYESLGEQPLTIGNKAQKAWKKIRWDQDAIEGYRSRIISNTSLLNTFNSGLTSKASQRAAENLAALNERVGTLGLFNDQQERLALLEWLTPLNFTPQQNFFFSRRQEGTGHWLLQSAEFKTWMSGLGTTLLCKGMPGAGKTMLACIVIEHLINTLYGGNALVAYIYCDYTRQHEQTHVNLIASILKQLLQHQVLVPEKVWESYRHHINSRTPPKAQEMYDLLQSSLSLFPQVYIVVDAVDELSVDERVRQTLLASLGLLQKVHSLNFLVTSRFIPHVTQELHDPPCLIVRASDEDVRRYVRGHISNLANCVVKNCQLQIIIEDSIASAVDGMFLLAQLHMDSLGDKTNPKAIRNALANLPKGSGAMDGAYKQAMQRIEDQRPGFRELAKRTLSWITCVYEPLTVGQLRYALATEDGETEIDEDNLDDIEDIISVCCGLVIVDPETTAVRFVHFTAQEYFERFRSQYFPNALEEIAVSCLTYLLSNESGKYWAWEYFGDPHSLKYSFLPYAARFWARHAENCHSTFEDKVGKLLVELLTDDCKVLNVGQIQIVPSWFLEPYFPARNNSCTYFSGLHLATYNNFAGLMHYLLEAGLFVADLRDHHGRTPLMLAANEGHEQAVRVLIHRQDVDVNALCPRYTPANALGWAARNGHVATVELLLERDDIDVNLIDNPKSLTPLVYAATRGHKAVLEILLKHRDLAGDCRISQRSEALFQVAYLDICNFVECVQFLLQRGNVDVNYRDKGGLTPLAVAALGGNAKVVKMLLEYEGLDVTSRDESGQTTLEVAYEQAKAGRNKYGEDPGGQYTVTIELLESLIRTRSSTG